MSKQMSRVSTYLLGLVLMLLPGVALAQEGIARQGDGSWIAVAVGIGMGIAALGGALGQGRTASAALEGIARNPNASDKVFVPMILGLSFIESLVLFTWVLMLLMQLKL